MLKNVVSLIVLLSWCVGTVYGQQTIANWRALCDGATGRPLFVVDGVPMEPDNLIGSAADGVVLNGGKKSFTLYEDDIEAFNVLDASIGCNRNRCVIVVATKGRCNNKGRAAVSQPKIAPVKPVETSSEDKKRRRGIICCNSLRDADGPFYVIDGEYTPSDSLSNPMEEIGPTHVRCIGFLKGDDAVIYGSGGQENGVVIVETLQFQRRKRGGR